MISRSSLLLVSITTAAWTQVPQQLTLQEAEALALKNHPAIAAAEFNALASQERIAQSESVRHPFVSANVTGAAAPEESRLAAGGLNNPLVLSRFATGVSVNQLLLDFGRTSRLVQGSRLASLAESEKTKATRADVLLNVQRTYYTALSTKTLVEIAKQTIASRQLLVDQVSALVQAQMKSGLDLSIANTNLAEARLLLSSAENERLSAHAQLAEAVGMSRSVPFELAEEPMPNVEPLSATELNERALRERPEIAAARFEADSLSSVAAAERALRFPSVTASFGAGLIPTRVQALSSDYVAAGLNVTLPFLNGGLYRARRKEAEFRAQSAQRRTRQVENAISREVSVALLNVNTAAERVTLTKQFIEQASQALELAQSRYDLGLSSIVELSQAQLVKTNAEIQHAGARYDYQIRRAVLNHRAGVIR
jgi:outer membrane protein